MDTKIIALLFKSIEEGTNIKKLRYSGLTYLQIGALINSQIEQDNLAKENDSIVLTKKGKEFLKENNHLIKEINKSKWIEVDYKNKIKSINENDVFLPSSKNLSFLK